MASTVPRLKPWYKRKRAAVAQMDRARASEARGREFESPQPHHFPNENDVFQKGRGRFEVWFYPGLTFSGALSKIGTAESSIMSKSAVVLGVPHQLQGRRF